MFSNLSIKELREYSSIVEHGLNTVVNQIPNNEIINKLLELDMSLQENGIDNPILFFAIRYTVSNIWKEQVNHEIFIRENPELE